ncbi:hypothetical protein EDD29_1234 [Actinocorallia herbida]|uniref:Mannosylglycerate hydrolase MGH1-like glycoside hydrolase domain-containing protein n=1 Tax=Actinocorallia herbida TaxID=58109 RepID=A0A3N1CQY3_9ACTN|nr:hypothetical protein [Actinocorallia herbida]ROO83726.1 hypothetical protein EDD29_1234 [Actinocorallia herbida]
MSPRLTGDETVLWQAAARVLDANWTGSATVPSPGLYPHQWSWDSGFVCLGLARHRYERAERELTSVLRGQWANGMVPHIVFNAKVARHAYFPGPELWRSAGAAEAPKGVETSGITLPPIQAIAALRLHAVSPDPERSRAFLRAIFPRLAAQQRYLGTVRDLGGAGLVSICHPWESGMDNSPAWDRPLAAVRLPPMRYAPGARPVSAPTGVDYDRYVWLVTAFRNAGYAGGHLRDDHPFAVEDPLVNGMYLASFQALAELAEVVGGDPLPYREEAERVRAALLDRLWDPEQRCFRALDVRTGKPVPAVTVAAFGPLLDPGLPAHAVRGLADLLLSSRFAGSAGYPVPTCDIQAAAFDRAAFWRGPAWISTNWIVWAGVREHGLGAVADLIHGSTLRLVRQSGFREFFDPFDGTGRGGHDFSWSAALVMDLLAARREGR